MTNLNYINGMSIWNAKKVARFTFAEAYFNMEKNVENRTYDLYLTADAEEDIINYYKEFWGKQYRIYIVEQKQK